MSSIFFTFHYDDGSNVPFDPETALDKGKPQYEVSEVTADGLIDIFEMSPEDLEEAGLTDAALQPAFIHRFSEDEEGYGERMLIPIEAAELKVWAETWLQTLQSMSQEERGEILIYNPDYADEIMDDLARIAQQSDCARRHKVSLMLQVSW